MYTSFSFGARDQNFRQWAMLVFIWEYFIIILNKNIFEMGKGNEQTVDIRGYATYKQLLEECVIFSVIKEMLTKTKWNTTLYLFQIFSKTVICNAGQILVKQAYSDSATGSQFGRMYL